VRLCVGEWVASVIVDWWRCRMEVFVLIVFAYAVVRCGG